jgi:transcriptional regulator with XRE-family HTH domain
MHEAGTGSREDGFATMFDEVGKRVEFWEENAIVGFTEDICVAMERAGVSRAELARRLGTSQAYVTKVLRGDANFTIKTMVRLALALDMEFCPHLVLRESRASRLDEKRPEPGRAQLPSLPALACATSTAGALGSTPG